MEIPSWKDILKIAEGLAKELDTPEMRELYAQEKRNNNALDELVKDMAQEIEDGFDHTKDSQ